MRLVRTGVGLIESGCVGEIAGAVVRGQSAFAMRLEGLPPAHTCVEFRPRRVAFASGARGPLRRTLLPKREEGQATLSIHERRR